MNKSIKAKAMSLAEQQYKTDFFKDETVDGQSVYLATHPQLPGCMAQGSTKKEAAANLKEATFEYILSLLEDNVPVPMPIVSPTTTTAGAINIIREYEQPKQPQNFMDDLSKAILPSTRHKIATAEWMS